MSSDEIIIELGLVSERTLGSFGTMCEALYPDVMASFFDPPGTWIECW